MKSTRGCLIALDRLARAGRASSGSLDLGCGSGVLALAAARLWPGPVLAADNDPDAVRVARENVVLNGLAGRVSVCKSSRLWRRGPPPRRPLRSDPRQYPGRPAYPHGAGRWPATSPPAAGPCSRGSWVRKPPRCWTPIAAQGLTLDFQLRLGEWSVLVLRKPKAKRRA